MQSDFSANLSLNLVMWFFTREEKELRELAKSFAIKELAPTAAHCDETQSYNIDALRKMGPLGLLGITADPEYGGCGLGVLGSTLVMEEFGRVCASSALSYLAHSILCVNNIDKNASVEHKKKYLPDLISGKWVGAMGMSEPGFGSDALGMQTKASLNEQGENSHYIINGTKTWITNGPIADIAFVYTRTGTKKKDITSFILEKEKRHFSAGKEIHKMGMRASATSELIFDQSQVPVFHRVGAEGDSVYHMMKNLELERITISGISLGIAKACLEQCVKYSNERKIFGKNLSEYQLMQKIIADMSTEITMMDYALYSIAKKIDLEGSAGPLLAAQLKLAIPQKVTKIALDAIQLHGGYGYSQEFPLERYMRDAKLMEIGAGTNEVMIGIIAKQLLFK